VNVDKIFESLSLKLSYNSNNAVKHCIVSSVYRSPSPVAGFSLEQQCNTFFDKLDQLLSELTEKRHDSYVFFDSNFNLLNVQNNGTAEHFLNLVHENSYLLTNFKATHMQNGSYSLIDQIITNSNTNVVHSGSIIDEISDHFITFLQPNLTRTKQKPKENKRRLINEQTIQNFKNDLANMDWRSVLMEINVNASYDKFWEIYNNLYETPYI
jgi:hypothetical protein